MGFETHSELFVEEALDLLRDIETPLMELENDPENQDLIDSIFRAMHTIKGSSGMFGFDEISHFTHDVETTFDAIRKGSLKATSEIIELTLAAKDCIRELLFSNKSETERDKRAMILSRLAELSGKKAPESSAAGPEPSIPAASSGSEESGGEKKSFRITFVPDREILLRGVQIVPLFADLDDLGQMFVRASFDAVPPVEEINPEYCYLSWEIDLATDRPERDIRSVFIFVEDYAKITIECLDGEGAVSSPESNPAPSAEAVPLHQDPAQKESPAQKSAPIMERRRMDTSSIRVKNEKLDILVNLVGEMVTLHARLAQESGKEGLPEFVAISESLGRLTADLRDITMSVRMVPLAETFSSFNRLIHDLSKNLGKKMRLETEGGETELDKNVIEELRDPLMHIIRNSADHGIEMPDKRRELGKDETGVVKLSAEHTGANVRINISDDGGGLDRAKILKKALDQGLLQNADVDDRTVYSLIFEPGFSTAAQATDISGRGVGMDVVKKNMEKLRGSIDVNTVPGQGSTISLTIPLTLAIIDGFMTEVCGQKYIFNLSLVRECVAYDGSGDLSGNQGLFRLRGDYIPFVDIRTLFDMKGEPCKYPQIVVTEVEGNTIGFLVDKVIGHCQTVIKPLGKGVRNADMFSGATILGDGSIALIVDVNHILSAVIVDEEKKSAKNDSTDEK
jgi:two-component system chemotaxis sensor kinase CheA